MRSNTATTRRVRLVIVLAVAAAVTVMLGAILVAASVVMRLLTRHEPANMTRLGLDVVAAGVAFGLVVLVVFAIARIGTAGTSRPPAATAHHRRGTAGSPPTASYEDGKSPEHGKSPGRGAPQGHRRDRLHPGAPAAGSGHGGARSGRPPVLNPTNVYQPGGLLDMPRDGRAPGTPGGQGIPEILRTAGPPPGASGAPAPGTPAGGWSQDRSSPGWAGAKPPRPGYQPGMNQAGPGRAPYAPGSQPPAPGSQPPPPMPPRDRMRPREAPRPGQAMPPRDAPRPGHGGPPRDAAMGPGGPIRPGGPVPPRDPAYPPPPGYGQHQQQGGGAGRNASGPGYAAPGGRRPGAQGYAGPPGPAGPAEASDQFDGGYAYVIRPSENPVRPASPTRPPSFGRPAAPARPGAPARPSESARPADPARPAESEVYVYRDTGGQPDDPAAAAQGPDEHDASYWYDLPATGAGGDTTPHVPEETRGPFEPLVSSADPPGATPRFSASLDDAEPAAPQASYSHEAPASASDDAQEDTAHAHARKLEQIKDLYLTAEAIGETNVDKHFDQLLAQQRELISDYFKHSSATRPGPDLADQAGAEPGGAGQEPGAPGDAAPSGGPAGAAEGTRVTADQPRAW